MSRCRNQARTLFCTRHWYQPWAAGIACISFFGVLAGIYQDAWRPIFGTDESTVAENAGKVDSASTKMTSQGDQSPVVSAGRDVTIGDRPSSSKRNEESADRTSDLPQSTHNEPELVLESKGDNSPVVMAGRDVIIASDDSKPDYITDHDGAGAVLMTEPNFKAFLSNVISSKGNKVIGRLINGTEVANLEITDADRTLIEANETTPPWVKVRVLEGRFEGKVGWILMTSLRMP